MTEVLYPTDSSPRIVDYQSEGRINKRLAVALAPSITG